MSSFGVSYFTFINFFNKKEKNFQISLLFLFKEKASEYPFSYVNFVSVIKHNFLSYVNNSDPLSSLMVWFILFFMFLLWKWKQLDWKIFIFLKGFSTKEHSQLFLIQSTLIKKSKLKENQKEIFSIAKL